MGNEIKNQVKHQVNYLGDSEYLLAVSRVEDPNDVNAIVEEVNKHRAPFESGKISSFGGAAYANQETWRAIASDADTAARRRLLNSSALLSEADELTLKAQEAKRLADEKNAELNRLWSEFSSLPDCIRSAQNELDGINSQLKCLDDNSLREEYKDWFREVLGSGSAVSPLVYATKAAILVGADLRREVLNEKANELEAQLVEYRKRNKELGKQLGKKQEL